MSEFFALIQALPAVLGLIKAIQSGIDEAKTDATVADHINQVKAAFDAKDASKLNAVFNSSST